jgi:hypothetical protein
MDWQTETVELKQRLAATAPKIKSTLKIGVWELQYRERRPKEVGEC